MLHSISGTRNKGRGRIVRTSISAAIGANNSFAPKRWILLPLGLAAILLVPFLPYLTDDTYIYFQFARNLAAGRGLAFNPGVPTYGFTSPLWVLLLAGLGGLGVPFVVVAKLLGALFTGLSIPLFFRLARRLLPSREGAVAATLAWTFNAWLLRWTLSGLETSVAVFLVLAGIGTWMEEKERGAPPRLSAVLFGLAALARPECLGLLPIAAVDLLVCGRTETVGMANGHTARRSVAKRLSGRFLWLAAGAGSVLLPWLIYARHTFGRFLPDTVIAKGGDSWFDPGAAFHAVRRIAPVYAATSAFELLIVVLAAALLWRKAWECRESLLQTHFLPVAWSLALPALFIVRGATVVSRYMLPSLIFVVLYGFALLDCLRARSVAHPALRARAPWVLLVAVSALNLAVLFGAALPATISFTRGLRESLVPIGTWLRDNTAPDATVAAADIGAIGYFSERKVFDLHGLVTPAMIPLQTMDIDEIVESFAFARVSHPDYLVDRYTGPDRFGRLGLHPGVLEPLFSRRMGDLGIARRGDYHYTVYRLHWDRFRP
jgi:hypothetical protein